MSLRGRFWPRTCADVRELRKKSAKIRAICGKGFGGLIWKGTKDFQENASQLRSFAIKFFRRLTIDPSHNRLTQPILADWSA
jgi:hypothetical protein